MKHIHGAAHVCMIVEGLIEFEHEVFTWQVIVLADLQAALDWGYFCWVKHSIQALEICWGTLYALLYGRLLISSNRLILVKTFDSCLARLLFHLSLQRRIKVVLYVVVCAAMEVARDFWPAVAVLLMKLKNFNVLLFCPPILFDVGIQMIVPTFAALFTDTTFQVIGNLAPISGAVLVDLLD